jgi:hypothetical protein
MLHSLWERLLEVAEISQLPVQIRTPARCLVLHRMSMARPFLDQARAHVRFGKSEIVVGSAQGIGC